MKKLLLFLTCFLTCFLTSVFVYAQITYQKTYGETGGDYGNFVQQTSDSGYILIGTSNYGAGWEDVYLIKTNINGDILWTKTFGGVSSDYGYSIQQTSDSGFIIAGSTRSFGAGNYDVYLIKTTANGDTLWTKTFGGPNNDYGNCVQQTSDGGYIIIGWTDSFGPGNQDVYLINTSSNGDTVWTKTFGGVSSDYGYSIQQTADGGYIIIGLTISFGTGSYDVLLIKTTTVGNIMWTKTFGGVSGDYGYSIQQTADGGYIIAGNTYGFGAGNNDVYLIKTTADGDISWTKTYGGTNDDYGNCVLQTSDGGYIIAGWTNSFGAGNQDVYLIKTSSNGDTVWTKTFGDAGWDIGNSVEQTADGGYIIVGITGGLSYYSVYLIKTDTNGNSGCNQENPATIINNPATQQSSPLAITNTPTTICTTPATIIGSGGTITTLCTNIGISELSSDSPNIKIYPNPANNYITINYTSKSIIEIANIEGQIVKRIYATENKITINISGLARGMYFIKVITDREIVTKKFIKE